MKTTLSMAMAGALALGSLGIAGTASALPANGIAPAIMTSADEMPKVDNVRWVCPPYRRCFWVPGGYGYGYGYGWRRPYGYYGGWHRWHRW